MSGNPSPVAKPAKTMSSRLLTMKFMQRAAASAATTQPQSPSIDDPDTPSPKRQRLSAASSPATNPNSDLQAISAAIAAEEQKRAEAITRQAAEAGETEWVLDYTGASSYQTQQPLIIAAESLDAENADMNFGGRRTYGNFMRKKKRQIVGQHESESESESSDADEDPVDFDTADPARIDSLIKKAKAKAGKKSKKKEKKKAQTEVRLSELSSISGGGGQSPLTSRGGFSRGGKGGGGGGGKKYHGGKFANKANKRSK